MSSGDESEGPRSRVNGRKHASDGSDAGDLDKASLASGDRNLGDDDAGLFGSGSEGGDEYGF